MRYEWSVYSDKGAREKNEDNASVIEVDGAIVAVLCDGLGGHGDGDIASAEAVKTIEDCFRLCPEVSEENISAIMDAANQNILELQTVEEHMRTTVVALFLSEEKCFVAHAGDSRLYALGTWKILYKTMDHSVTQMAALVGAIEEKNMGTDENRNRVLKSLGNVETKVTVRELPISLNRIKGFLLCSDGFWEHFTEKEIMHYLSMSRGRVEHFIQNMICKIQKEMSEHQDNYTAIGLIKNKGVNK